MSDIHNMFITDPVDASRRLTVNASGEGLTKDADVLTALGSLNTLLSAAQNKVSTANSSTAALNTAAVFTGTWEDAKDFDSLVVALKTDQDGTLTIQFSPDGTNADSTLTRYYRTAQIEPPHRFTITRQYYRVTFTNTSASNQTYLRLQTILGNKTPLNTPLDAVLAQDYDAQPVRPSNYEDEVALGLRQGYTLWNKWGYNDDVDTGSNEVVAAFGGTFTPMTTARTLSVVSTSTDDDGDPAGIGAQTVRIYGIDANRVAQIVDVTLDGTTPVVTVETWLGVNRAEVIASGTSLGNVGTITLTATTDATVQASIPAGEGVTQQCIFHTQKDHKALIKWLNLNVLKLSGSNPVVTLKGWVFNALTNTKSLRLRDKIDTAVENTIDISLPTPLTIPEQSVFWIEATTDSDNTVVDCRFSLVEARNVEA